MGDRGNVYVHHGDAPGVYLYTHNHGDELPEIVGVALDVGEARWTDPPYLTRIIFCTMVGEQWDGTTGYGIDTQLGDGGHQIVDVDTEAQAVSLVGIRAHTPLKVSRSEPIDFRTYVNASREAGK